MDLKGVVSFRHLTSQLREIQTIIGKMLLEDFQTFIASEINKETVHVKATSLSGGRGIDPGASWSESFDGDRLRSVIFGLLRQSSYSFLEALEEAAVGAVKQVMRDVATNFAAVAKATSPSKTAAKKGQFRTNVRGGPYA